MTEDEKRIRRRDATRRYRARRRAAGIVDTTEQIAKKRANARASEIKLKAENPDEYKRRRRQYTATYRKQHPEKAKASTYRWRDENRNRWNEMRRAGRAKHIIHYLLKEARHRANRAGIDCTVTLDDLPPLPEKCPIFGIDIIVGGRGRNGNAPSIDRIDPTRGYIPGNVWIISDRANRVKNNGTAAEHELIAKAMHAASPM